MPETMKVLITRGELV